MILEVPVQKMQKTAEARRAIILIVFLIFCFSVKILIPVSTVSKSEKRLLKIET
jgi:hypothetical protein